MCKQLNSYLPIKTKNMKIRKFANTIDPDEAAHYDLFGLNNILFVKFKYKLQQKVKRNLVDSQRLMRTDSYNGFKF